MTRAAFTVWAALALGGAGAASVLSQEDASRGRAIRLGDYDIYVHRQAPPPDAAPFSFVIAVKGDEQYAGTLDGVVPIVRGDKATDSKAAVAYSKGTLEDRSGLFVRCGSALEFYARADDRVWTELPDGKDTRVPVCPVTGGKGDCASVAAPCATVPLVPRAMPSGNGEAPRTSGATPRTNGNAPRANGDAPKAGGLVPQAVRDAVKALAAQRAGQAEEPAAAAPAAAPGTVAAAPKPSVVEGERVQPAEVMIYTHAQLVEEGPAVGMMSQIQQNIDTVRYNINSYRAGYSIPQDKIEERVYFKGATKAWRAVSTQDVSMWPPFTYPQSRNEAIRRAKLLEPILIAEPLDEMNNLRLYYMPVLVGHDGQDYRAQPMVLAFFMDPATAQRMTVVLYDGRAYGAVGKPLTASSQIYIQDAASYSAGLLGVGRAYIPSIFYSRNVQFDVAPFSQGDNLERLTAGVLRAHPGVLAADDFLALAKEMGRYTGAAR